MFTNTLSNEEMTKIKVVDLDEYYNFYIHDFFSSNHLVSQNHMLFQYVTKFCKHQSCRTHQDEFNYMRDMLICEQCVLTLYQMKK